MLKRQKKTNLLEQTQADDHKLYGLSEISPHLSMLILGLSINNGF
mgnify:FL=1